MILARTKGSISRKLNWIESYCLQGQVGPLVETYVWNLIWGNTRHQIRTNSFLNPLGGLL